MITMSLMGHGLLEANAGHALAAAKKAVSDVFIGYPSGRVGIARKSFISPPRTWQIVDRYPLLFAFGKEARNNPNKISLKQVTDFLGTTNLSHMSLDKEMRVLKAVRDGVLKSPAATARMLPKNIKLTPETLKLLNLDRSYLPVASALAQHLNPNNMVRLAPQVTQESAKALSKLTPNDVLTVHAASEELPPVVKGLSNAKKGGFLLAGIALGGVATYYLYKEYQKRKRSKITTTETGGTILIVSEGTQTNPQPEKKKKNNYSAILLGALGGAGIGWSSSIPVSRIKAWFPWIFGSQTNDQGTQLNRRELEVIDGLPPVQPRGQRRPRPRSLERIAYYNDPNGTNYDADSSEGEERAIRQPLPESRGFQVPEGEDNSEHEGTGSSVNMEELEVATIARHKADIDMLDAYIESIRALKTSSERLQNYPKSRNYQREHIGQYPADIQAILNSNGTEIKACLEEIQQLQRSLNETRTILVRLNPFKYESLSTLPVTRNLSILDSSPTKGVRQPGRFRKEVCELNNTLRQLDEPFSKPGIRTVDTQARHEAIESSRDSMIISIGGMNQE